MQLNILEELIDLDELSVEKFSIEESVNNAKLILGNIKEYEEIIIDLKFSDDIWIFEDHLQKGVKIYFDFNELEKISKFRTDWNDLSVVLVKCWVAELLSDFHPATVRNKFGKIIKIIEQTDFFSIEKLDEFIEYLQNYTPVLKNMMEQTDVLKSEVLEEELKKDSKGISTIYEIINTSINFLTYSELESMHVYHKSLLDIKNKLPNSIFSRNLPKGKDVLKLDNIINQYFVEGFNNISRLFFAPILLWWKITNIIPMRISEFCNMKRDCLLHINERYYIRLPREKKSATERRIQIVDTLEITKEIHDLINDYIQHTSRYGESKTLISYRSLIDLGVIKTGRANKKNKDYFHRKIFSTLLKRFYKEVVYHRYPKSIKREVRPNDTRHFAFCSLLMQGLSPIEIARLGGHSTLEAQYHYSNHTEYFIDVEVKKLIDRFKYDDGKLRGTTLEGQEITFLDIENKSMVFPPKDNVTRYPMEIGFCTDELQRCESLDCMLCKHWWIHPKDIEEVKPLIQKKIVERRQKIIEMGTFLKNLNQSLTTEMVKQSEINPDTFIKMKTDSISIQEHIEEIACLELLKGDEDNE